jgi:LPS-assembly protein
MRRRLLLFILPSIYAPASVASEALWNCEQNKDSKEWVCTGEKKPVAKSSAEKTPTTVAPVETIRSTVTQPESLGAEKNVKPEQPLVNIQEKHVAEQQPTVPKAVETIQPVLAKPETIKPQQEPAGIANEQQPSASFPVSTKAEKAKEQVSDESRQVVQPSVEADSKNSLQTEANRPGWTCDAKAADQNWDCKLAGSDPKGQARIIETSQSGLDLLTPAFDYNEEQTFDNLKSQLKYDPWKNCTAPRKTKANGSKKEIRDAIPLDINSNYAEVFENEIYSYTGNVEMTHGGQRSVSKKASYDNVSGALDLQGSVYYSDEELALHSETASINLTSDQAKLRNALFIYPAAPLRGRAKTIYRDSSTLSRYQGIAYTSCRPGNQDWVIHASELKINKTTGQGSARNAWLEFKGTPVFYSPLLDFPTDNRRLSGFLAPNFGNTQKGGFAMATPYYWNIAPNYDATIRPRYLSNRGVILGANFRYLTEMSKGTTNLEYMPNDNQLNKSRYLAAFKNTTQFMPHLSSNLDVNYVSDKTYFSDLGNALSTSTYSSFLKSQANLAYVNTGVSLTGHADSYESIDPAIKPNGIPYRRLPQVNLNLNHSFDFMPLTTLMDAEYVYFQHDALDNAQRTNVKPSVSFPMKTAGSYLTPKLSVQSTQYLLSNPQGVQSASLSRTLPIFSTDSGLYLEKDVNFSDRSYLHTLEPRLFYLYIPRVDQKNIPIFDSALIDSSFNSLFLENRFSGTDRVQDANQLTAALTTRLVDAQSGKERLKFSLGQIAYFQDREVTLNSNLPNFLKYNYPVETNKFSNLVNELNAGLTDHISLTTGTQWDPHLNEIVRHTSGLHYLNKPDPNLPGEIFNLGYRYRKNTLIPVPAALAGTRPYDIIQSDVSFHWPVYNEWSVVGRWTYSLLNDRTQESFLGVEKENCCWAFRLIGRRWVNSVALLANDPNTPTPVLNATGNAQSGIFFEIELKGLSAFGERLDTFFEKQIYGYRKVEK